MALNLTQAEQDALNSRISDQPATATIPSDEDILNGVANPATDIVLTPSSGLPQDILAAQDAIDQANQRLLDLQPEIDMAVKVVTYYDDILGFYELEKQQINGIFETNPWTLSEASEANNIYNNVATRYFPNAKETSPLQINSFPEETGQGATSTTADNLINRWTELETAVDNFTTTYNDSERTNDIPVGSDPPTQQEIDDYEAAKLAVIDAVDNALAIFTTASTHLAPPIPDEETTGADTDAAARKAELDTTVTILTELDGYTIFPDVNLANFQAHRSLPIPQANARLTQIGNYPLSSYYGIRAGMAVELADFGEGLYYKKLQEQDNIVQQTNRKAQLERKLATYQGI